MSSGWSKQTDGTEQDQNLVVFFFLVLFSFFLPVVSQKYNNVNEILSIPVLAFSLILPPSVSRPVVAYPFRAHPILDQPGCSRDNHYIDCHVGECEGRDEGMFGLSLVVLVWMFTMASLGQKGYKHFFYFFPLFFPLFLLLFISH